MRPEDLMEFTKIILGVATNFSAVPPEQLFEFWFDLFTADNISIDHVKKAALHIVRSRKYTTMPTYADFINAIQEDGETILQDTAEIQALYVITCIGQNYPKWDDPITKLLMTRRWVWSQWSTQVLESELKWWAEEFKRIYKTIYRSNHKLLTECPDSMKSLVQDIGKDFSKILQPKEIRENHERYAQTKSNQQPKGIYAESDRHQTPYGQG